MKNIKKFSFLLIAIVTLQKIYCMQNDESMIATEIAQIMAQNDTYKGYLKRENLVPQSNDAFIYTKDRIVKASDNPMLFGTRNYKIDFDMQDNMFNDGKTITITVKYLKNGAVWKQMESWTSANSSILTWKNAALAAGALGTIGATAYLLSRGSSTPPPSNLISPAIFTPSAPTNNNEAIQNESVQQPTENLINPVNSIVATSATNTAEQKNNWWQNFKNNSEVNAENANLATFAAAGADSELTSKDLEAAQRPEDVRFIAEDVLIPAAELVAVGMGVKTLYHTAKTGSAALKNYAIQKGFMNPNVTSKAIVPYVPPKPVGGLNFVDDLVLHGTITATAVGAAKSQAATAGVII